MSKDIAIEEIRAVRRKISAQYGHNTKALLKHYKELEARYKDRIASKPSVATSHH